MFLESNHKRPLLVSTDSVWGDISRVKMAYDDVLNNLDLWHLIHGIEAIHMGRTRPDNGRFFQEYQYNNPDLPIVGLHGEMGYFWNDVRWFDNLKANVANAVLAPLSETCELAKQLYGCQYVLFHDTALLKPNQRDQVVQTLSQTGTLVLVENHPYPYGLPNSVAIAQELTSRGVTSGVVVDWFHLLAKKGLNFTFEHEWNRVIGEIQALLEKLLDVQNAENLTMIAHHLPFGTNTQDSLPFDKMHSSHFKAMKAIIDKTVRIFGGTILVFENQQRMMGNVPLTSQALAIQSKRNQQVLRTLSDHYLFS